MHRSAAFNTDQPFTAVDTDHHVRLDQPAEPDQPSTAVMNDFHSGWAQTADQFLQFSADLDPNVVKQFEKRMDDPDPEARKKWLKNFKRQPKAELV